MTHGELNIEAMDQLVVQRFAEPEPGCPVSPPAPHRPVWSTVADRESALAMATGMFAGRLAATTDAYLSWSYGLQLAAAQFFMTVGGHTARPARSVP